MWISLQTIAVQALLQARPDYVKPVGASDPAYFELLEKNTHIVYPVLAIGVLVLLVGGILQAWRTQDLDGMQKDAAKRELVLLLRREMHGATVEVLAKELGLTSLRLLKLLEALQQEGIVISHTNTQRVTTWSLKGINPGHRR
jgi:hypothetical protein